MSQILCALFPKTTPITVWVAHKTVKSPIVAQLRWKKTPKRKPKWLPMAPSKVFRIPKHPYVPPEENKLVLELVDEYFRKIESIRKLFQTELAKKSEESAMAMELLKEEEEEHQRLMEENRKENERVRLIREETMEKELQDTISNLLQSYEEHLEEEERTTKMADEIVRKAKIKHANCLSYETLDAAIENALDNPVNVNFAIDLQGTITWEGKPPKDYEEVVRNRFETQ